MTVDEALEPIGTERGVELVSKLQVIATVGNKDAKLPSVGRDGPARLLHSDTSAFRRSWTGCVMHKICQMTSGPYVLARQVGTLLAGIAG
jgi:hypothetical protein